MGAGGIIILCDVARVMADALRNPVVHGQLPATITGSLDPVLERTDDPGEWPENQKRLLAGAFEWALVNLGK